MKLGIWISAAIVAAGLATTQVAFAQSDRTMGIDCTVAGHIRCGENGPIWGSRYHSAWWYHHRHRHYYGRRY